MSFMCSCCWKHPEYDAIRDGPPLKLSIEDEKDYRLTSLLGNWHHYLKSCQKYLTTSDYYHFPTLFGELLDSRDFDTFFVHAKEKQISYFLLY